MAANKSVVVLTPNHRRKTINVTPNTTVLQILEDVCLKENLQPDEYDLKHHRKVLDTTTTLQFSGLPNNALLEMVPVQRVRKESSVSLVLQLESGDRLTGTFMPSDTLWTVVKRLCPEEEEDGSGKGTNPVVIYMRQEIIGVEALKGMTLRHLGLTGGRALLRFVHRTLDALHTQANVSAPLKRVQVIPKETTKEKQSKVRDTTIMANTVPPDKRIEESVTPQQQQSPFTPTMSSKPASPAQGSSVKRDNASASDKMDVDAQVTGNHVTRENAMCMSDGASPDVGYTEPIVLGARDAIVFYLDTAPEVCKEELPDSFFNLTVEDARLIHSDLSNKRAELEDAPLTTSAMRELEKSKQILNNLNRYKKVVLRIQFPDRTVLQGIFSPTETVYKVMEFVRQYLEKPNISFYLFTTPPKQILEADLTLAEAGCVPCALLHFGCDTINDGIYIKPDILLQSSSSFSAAMAAARICRGKVQDSSPKVRRKSRENRPSSPQPSTSRQSDEDEINQSRQSRTSTTKDGKKVPKWFKTVK